MKKRIISLTALFLLIAMLLPIMACTEGNNTDVTTVASVTEAPKTTSVESGVQSASTASPTTEASVTTGTQNTRLWLDDIPDDLTFEGKEVVIAYADIDSQPFTARSLEPDENSTDLVDSAVIERNRSVEERLKIKIKPLRTGNSFDALQNTVNSPILSGAKDYDIVAGYQYHDIDMATKNLIININRIPEQQNHIDTSKSYWGGKYIDTITYKDYLYWVTGDLSLRYIGGAYCTFVNKKIYDSVLTQTYGNIYDVVRNKDWTIDTFAAMGQLAYQDLDSVEGISEDDRIGFVTASSGSVYYSFALCAGVEYSSKNVDGTYSIALGNDKTQRFISKFYPMNYSGYTFFASPEPMDVFAAGGALFTINKLFMAEAYLRNMDDDYYVVPVPMSDKTQGDYKSDLHNGVTIYGIASSIAGTDKVEVCTATLEMLCAESQRLVTSRYYDNALKYKYTRDDDSAEMIETIHNSVQTDFALAWTRQIGGISEIFSGVKNEKSFTSALRRTKEVYETKLSGLLEKLDKIDAEQNVN